MLPEVYFSEEINEEGIRKLNEAIFSTHPFKRDCNVAIKVHIGEELNTLFIPPKYIKPVLNELSKTTKRHFLTDTNTLYSGMRSNTRDHLELAKRKGFRNLETEFIIADSKREDEVSVKVNLPLFKEVKIAKHIAEVDAIVGISHFKGHDLFGFGGTIKNLGMGCASRSAKLKMHAGVYPSINDNCSDCGICVNICPANAISLIEKKVNINWEDCIGCGMCIGYCKQKAIEVPWESVSIRSLQEKCAEHAFGAIANKKGIYFNYIYNVSSKCDCARDSPLIGKDIGIVVSIDPVACDKAAYDLTLERNKKNIFLESKGLDGRHILYYSQKIGLGNLSYRLIQIK